MDQESDVVRYDFGPLLQGQMRVPKLKRAVFPMDTMYIGSLMC